MTGFNLPPGCSVSMLPGNTPEEQAEEAAYEHIISELEAEKLLVGESIDESDSGEEWEERLVRYIMRKIGEARSQAFADGASEERGLREQAIGELMAEERFCYARRNTNGSWHACAKGDEGAVLFLEHTS